MKKRKNVMAKVVAGVALFAIVLGIVGTGILVVVNSFSTPSELSLEDLQEYVETLSGATIETVTGSTVENPTESKDS